LKIQKITNKNNWRATILRLGIASFINDIISEIILLVLPMFFLSLGGGPVIIGLIEDLRNSIEDLANVFIGHLSDTIGRRKIFVSYFYFSYNTIILAV